MLAVIWHVWIGVVLLFVAVASTLNIIVGYVRKVVAPQYPNKRNSEE
ncbi:MAG: hypothetical protein ABIR68_12890 [Ilumatobacteraceae bacterium]